jgi:hypothetical protein
MKFLKFKCEKQHCMNREQGAKKFMKERLNVNIAVRKVRCPHNFCQDCSCGVIKNKNPFEEVELELF